LKNKTIILPSSYLPSIYYFYLILKHKNVLIESHDFYIKQSLRNHTIILGPNGDQKLTVPINRKGKSKTIFKNVKISNKIWKKKHMQSIKTAYGNSPFFIHYVDQIFEIINYKTDLLSNLNKSLLTYFLKELNIKNNITYTNEYLKDYGHDFLDCRNKKIHSNNIQSIYYQQTFLNKSNNLEKYSIIDLLFNIGNESKNTIISILKKNK
tara:strand:- start:360 stop:986 length:627 start_codon:yes stop_codon:yes gene_type:complete